MFCRLSMFMNDEALVRIMLWCYEANVLFMKILMLIYMIDVSYFEMILELSGETYWDDDMSLTT